MTCDLQMFRGSHAYNFTLQWHANMQDGEGAKDGNLLDFYDSYQSYHIDQTKYNQTTFFKSRVGFS